MTLRSKLRSVFDVRANRLDREGNRTHMFPDPARNMVVVLFGEFCGTFMFLLLAFIGVQTAQKANNPTDPNEPLLSFSLLFIACSFGASLAVNVWIFYRVTGGMFNPAVTLGLALVGAVTPIRALLIFPTQMVAGICAAAVADGLLPGPLTVGDQLQNGTNTAQGLFIEMFLTAQLVLTVFFLAVEKHRSTYLAPVGLGISIFICHICGTNYTGTGINPARSFGPDVIQGFPGYHWIYWLGPFMGSILAWIVYSILKWLEYQTANPGQDADDVEKANRDAALPSDAKIRAAAHADAKHHHHRDHSQTDSVMDPDSSNYNHSSPDNYNASGQAGNSQAGNTRYENTSGNPNYDASRQPNYQASGTQV